MKIKILSLLCLVLSLGSCNKWLDVDLIDRVNEDKLFSSSSGFDEALAGVYSQMARANLYGRDLTIGYMDTYAQYYSAGQGYDLHATYKYTDAAVQSLHAGIWKNMYSVISGANNILLWAEKNASVMTPEKQRQVKGEAIAVRALIHFDLIRMFCPDIKISPKANGIPYNKIFGVSLPHQYTVEECVQLVLNDLEMAESLLVDEPITQGIPYMSASKDEADKLVARMNLYAVKAIKARLYLMRDDYPNAIKYAQEVIDSKKFRLLEFADIDKGDAEIDIIFSDEHIFSLRNKNIPEEVKKLFVPIVTAGSTQNPPLRFKEASAIYEVNMSDVRYIKWFQAVGEFLFLKYSKENTEKFFPKIPMIKLSEMYLIVAEASFNEDPDKALEYVNTVRNHRIKNNQNWQYLTRDYIFSEMQREFLAEGQLWFAYKRLNKVIPTGSIDGDVQPSNSVFVFPMPIKEIDNGNRPLE